MSTREDREWYASQGEFEDDPEPIDEDEDEPYWEPQSSFM